MRYLCPAGVFHDWSDDQPEPAEPQVPPLKFCPQHGPSQRVQLHVQDQHPNQANTAKEKEEKQNP